MKTATPLANSLATASHGSADTVAFAWRIWSIPGLLPYSFQPRGVYYYYHFVKTPPFGIIWRTSGVNRRYFYSSDTKVSIHHSQDIARPKWSSVWLRTGGNFDIQNLWISYGQAGCLRRIDPGFWGRAIKVWSVANIIITYVSFPCRCWDYVII